MFWKLKGLYCCRLLHLFSSQFGFNITTTMWCQIQRCQLRQAKPSGALRNNWILFRHTKSSSGVNYYIYFITLIKCFRACPPKMLLSTKFSPLVCLYRLYVYTSYYFAVLTKYWKSPMASWSPGATSASRFQRKRSSWHRKWWSADVTKLEDLPSVQHR